MTATINTSALSIESIKRDGDTQYRVNMDNEQVAGLADLIERGVKWKTPIQVASFDGQLFLTDGFHRVMAYLSLGISELPEGSCEIVECSSINEVTMLAMRANAAHGNKNSVEDRLLMVNKLLQMDKDRFMKNAFMVDINEVMDALQIAKMQARLVVDPKNAELKEKRNAAILELHNGGKSFREIDRALGLGNGTARGHVEKNVTVTKISTPESSSTSVPTANTEDRSDTRRDADAYFEEALGSITEFDSVDEDDTGCPFSLSEDWNETPDFNICAVTGLEETQATNSKPTDYDRVQTAKVSPVKLQEDYMDLCDKIDNLCAHLSVVKNDPMKGLTVARSLVEAFDSKQTMVNIAAQAGISLPE